MCWTGKGEGKGFDCDKERELHPKHFGYKFIFCLEKYMNK